MAVDQVMVARNDDSNKPRFRVDWTINPSHIIAFVMAIIAILSFIYGLRTDLQDTNSKLERLVIELKSKNELQDAEIKQIRDSNVVSRAEEIQFRSEMRSSVAELNKLLTEVRMDQAASGGRKVK